MGLEKFSLKGKVALITCSGRSIGKGIALCMAECGADIVSTARTVKEIEQTAAVLTPYCQVQLNILSALPSLTWTTLKSGRQRKVECLWADRVSQRMSDGHALSWLQTQPPTLPKSCSLFAAGRLPVIKTPYGVASQRFCSPKRSFGLANWGALPSIINIINALKFHYEWRIN